MKEWAGVRSAGVLRRPVGEKLWEIPAHTGPEAIEFQNFGISGDSVFCEYEESMGILPNILRIILYYLHVR